MIGDAAVLLVIDVQNDFLPGGSLAVPRGDEVIAVINALARRFANVILTQDWHPANHVSFASTHTGRKPFETVALAYGPQVLWPDHCVQATRGAALADGLDLPQAQAVIRKGYHRHTDSYSAFVEADRVTLTGLTGLLREREIDTVYAAGLATDFCVAWSLLDARRAGFAAVLVEDACRAIDTQGSLAQARKDLAAAGVSVVRCDEIA
jgi:nicotinamidase/pyrazinamidase